MELKQALKEFGSKSYMAVHGTSHHGFRDLEWYQIWTTLVMVLLLVVFFLVL